MFTGLIEAVCQVKAIQRDSSSIKLTIDLGPLVQDCNIGDSIAINGTCLTVTKINRNTVDFDVSGETLEKSNLGKLVPASLVNIERAMKADSRFGGHIVQGHVDGTATIERIENGERFCNIKFSVEPELLEQMVIKGSVAVEGISLTIADMDQTGFTVAIIPQTLQKTTLGKVKVADKVNIETDIINKIIKKQLDKILPGKEKLTVDKLKQLGF